MANKYLDLNGLKAYNKALLVGQLNDVVSYSNKEGAGFTISTFTESGDTVVKGSKTLVNIATLKTDLGITDVVNAVTASDPTTGTNGTISVVTNNGSATEVAVKGLGNAAYTDLATAYNSADTTSPVTGAVVASAIQGIAHAMVFKGTLGTAGADISSLPAPSDANTGYTYKVIADGTYTINTDPTTTITAKAGDVVISNGTAWELIPSGDEPAGDLTNVIIDTATGKVTDAITASKNSTNGVVTLTVEKASASNYGVVHLGNNTVVADTNGYLSVPTASDSALGVVKVNTVNGISLDSNSTLKVNTANANGIIVDSTSNNLTLKLTATSGIVLNTTNGAEGYEISTISYTAGGDIDSLFSTGA